MASLSSLSSGFMLKSHLEQGLSYEYPGGSRVRMSRRHFEQWSLAWQPSCPAGTPPPSRPTPDTRHSLCRPSVEMTSPSRATRWRAGSRPASPTPPSGARWSTRAPKPRASASTSRSPNGPSSQTSPCELSLTQSGLLHRSSRGLIFWFRCRNVNGITFMGSVKEKTVARNLYAQARARGKAAGIVRYRSSFSEL